MRPVPAAPGVRQSWAWGGLRLFVGTVDEPRSRRATDGLLLAASVAAIAALTFIARRTGFDARVYGWLSNRLPHQLDALWWLLVLQLVVLALVLLVAAVVRMRLALVRDLTLTVLLSVGGCLGVVWLQGTAESPGLLLTAAGAAVIVGASPHVTRPVRALGRWSELLAVLGAVLLGAGSPSVVVSTVLGAMIAAAIVHLALGSCMGRPGVDDIRDVLIWLGIEPATVGAAERQPAGVFVVEATDTDGTALTVKVYGRDAHDTQIVTSLWRTVWYRDTDAPTFHGRRQQAEHEAFVTLLAAQTGVLTQQVVVVTATRHDDVVLVLRSDDGPTMSDSWDDRVAARAWTMLELLHKNRIAHGQLDRERIAIGGDRVGLVDFRAAVVNPREHQLLTDRAQLLVTTALELGVGAAVSIAEEALGTDGLAESVPYLQLPLLTPSQRRAVRRGSIDLDVLRDRAAAGVGVDAPQLRRLRRVTWRSAAEIGLLLIAFLALWSGLGGLDLPALVDQLAEATPWLVGTAFVLAQLPRISQTVSTLGASPVPVPAGPVYALQLASSYLSLAVPSSAGRIAVSVRFFQRRGLTAGSALAVGALDGLTQWMVQAGLIAGVLLLTSTTLQLDLGSTVVAGLQILAIVIAAVVVVAGLALTFVARLRRAVLARVHDLAGDGLSVVRGLGSSRRLGMLVGGNLATELLFVLALKAFGRSMGYGVGFTELLVLLVSVSLIAAIVPIPGGIGIVETGLVVGLVGMGMPEDAAFATVLLYRLSTFYLPPVWGYFAQRWLLRSGQL